MYHGDSRPHDQATDTAMTALYRHLDHHDLDIDTPFDTTAGLRDLTARINTEPATAPDPGTPPAPAWEAPGREREFARFYREHFRRVTAYLTALGATVDQAADAAQDAMITVYEHWADITSPRAYLYKAAHRAFIRDARAAARLPASLDSPELAGLQDPREPDGLEMVLQTERAIQLLRTLPPLQRQVLALTYDDWTPAQIAELLAIHPATIRSTLRHARRSANQDHRDTGRETR
jgi:RNA polymerase sigma-70 factor (ECF subfamily)